MKRGDLVRFTSHVYKEWGLGIIMEKYVMTDSNRFEPPGFFFVFTPVGRKLVSALFMEVISENR
jgi:hypothetical protein